MAKILSLFLWSAVFCVALLVIDLLFMHVPMSAPGLKESRRFYLDFRARVISLRAPAPPAPSIEGIIEQNVAPVPELPSAEPAPVPALAPVSPARAAKPPAPPPAAKAVTKPKVAAKIAPVAVAPPRPSAAPATTASGYFYADERGELHFVDRLDQVPQRYRKEAQPLAN